MWFSFIIWTWNMQLLSGSAEIGSFSVHLIFLGEEIWLLQCDGCEWKNHQAVYWCRMEPLSPLGWQQPSNMLCFPKSTCFYSVLLPLSLSLRQLWSWLCETTTVRPCLHHDNWNRMARPKWLSPLLLVWCDDRLSYSKIFSPETFLVALTKQLKTFR